MKEPKETIMSRKSSVDFHLLINFKVFLGKEHEGIFHQQQNARRD